MSSRTSVTTTGSTSLSTTPSIMDEGPLVNRYLVIAHLVAGMAMLILALIYGFLYSLQFIGLYPFGGLELFSPGRVRFVHTNTVAYGFMANMFVGALYWVVPRLTKRRVLSDKLGWFLFVAWNFTVLLAIVGYHAGYAQAVEWGETPNGLAPLILYGELHPFWVDELITIGLIGIAFQFLVPLYITGVKKPMYVTGWYVTAGITWVLLVHLMGSYLPEVLPGAGGAVFVGLFIHDLVGLFVTPLGWGLMYYFVPSIIKKPIWSHAVSLLGFWGLAFFYPLGGVHHFLYSTIPMFAQYGAVVSTVAVEVMVTTVFVNFFMTLRGRENYLRTSIPIRYFYTGMIFYVTTCIQCAVQTQFWAQEFIHFTDWVVGHAHLVMYGVFGFWMLGMTMDLWPRLVGKPTWYSRGLNEWAYWLNVLGISGMFIGLTAGGLIEGFMWQGLAPWESYINSLQMPWRFRSLSGVMIIASNSLFLFNMVMTALPAKVSVVKYAKPASVPAGAGD